jgi:hypothetical protein
MTMSPREATVRVEAGDVEQTAAVPAEEPAAASVPAAPPAFVPKPLPVQFLYALTSISAAVMQGLGTSLISANLQQIAGPLGATQNEAAWLVAAYLVPNASLGLFLFKVRTQYGIRNFCELAIIPYVLISLAHLWVNDLSLSIALRFFAGAAAAPISSMAFLYMLEIFPPEKKLNIGLCMALIGLSLATPIAGLVSPSLLDARDLQGLYPREGDLFDGLPQLWPACDLDGLSRRLLHDGSALLVAGGRLAGLGAGCCDFHRFAAGHVGAQPPESPH